MRKLLGQELRCLLGVVAAAMGSAAQAETGVTNILDGVIKTTTNYYVGSNGAFNALVITNAGALRVVSGSGYIGNSAVSSNNIAVVTGTGSLWTNSGSSFVGSLGSGNNLTIADGGAVFFSGVTAGSQAGSSNNLITITGPGSVLRNSANLLIGGSGASNRMVITNGGEVFSAGLGYIGNYASSSNNAVTVTGAGSVWSNTGGFYVGYNGSRNTLTITNGGRVFSGRSMIGLYGSNNTAIVTGAGSQWNITSNLYAGTYGASNTLAITDGGQVVASSMLFVGNGTNAFGNQLYAANVGSNASAGLTLGGVNGNVTLVSNSFWNLMGGPLVLGGAGSYGNTLKMDGTSAITNIVGLTLAEANTIYYMTNSAAGLVFDSYTASQLRFAPLGMGGLAVGAGGSNTTLVISNYTLRTTAASYVGNGSGTNTVRVAGPGAVWDANSTLIIGTNRGGNSLVIADGGQVFNSDSTLGANAASRSNTVTVTGAGSVWSNSGSVYVGNSGAGDNLLDVSSGGTVTASNIVVGAGASSGNRISVSGGSLYATNAAGTGALNVNYGTLALNGGTVAANNLFLTNNADSVMAFSAGLLQSGGSVVSNGSAFLIGDGMQTATLDLLGGTHSFASGLSISTNGNLVGNGDIIGSVTNFGSLAPGHSVGLVGISGDLMLMESSILMMEIGGVSTNDHLDISGLLQAGGWLNVTFTGGYTGNAGDSFDLFDFGSVNGMFSQTNLPTLGGGLQWNTSKLYTQGNLNITEIVPEPGSAALLALGLAGIATRQRKRKR